MKLVDEAIKVLQNQDYSKKPVIAGVRIVPLKRFNDDGGSFTELIRLNRGKSEGEIAMDIAQINFSEMEPGAIKAFHIHEKQTDLWYVPPMSKILLILIDLRKDSPTKNLLMRLMLGDCNSQLVLIPPGIAHGCKNLLQCRSSIIYFVDKQFSADPDESDEKRLPWNFRGEEVWETPKE